MSIIKKITAFSSHETSIGEQVAFTYSEIDSDAGKITAQNNRAEVVVLDEDVKTAIKAVRDFLESKIPE